MITDAGIYIPQIADTIRRGNLEQSHHINLMGFMIGNGCSGKDTFNCGDPPDNDDFLMSSGGMQLDFLHGHGLVGRDLFNDIKDTCTGPKPDWGADPQCIGIVMSEPMCGLTIQEFANQCELQNIWQLAPIFLLKMQKEWRIASEKR